MKSEKDLSAEDQEARLVQRGLDLAMSGFGDGLLFAVLRRSSLDLRIYLGRGSWRRAPASMYFPLRFA